MTNCSMSYKASLRESIRTLEAAKKTRWLDAEETAELEYLYYKLDTNQDYLNESSGAYENQ